MTTGAGTDPRGEVITEFGTGSEAGLRVAATGKLASGMRERLGSETEEISRGVEGDTTIRRST